MFKEYDHLVKLVVIGNSGVGKSSLMMRFSDDSFTDSYLTTIGVDFRFKSMIINSESVKIQIWDTAGQERFRTITNAYYKGADGIVIVYDKSNSQSFEDINTYWMNEIESYGEQNVQLLLLGNKCDSDNSQIDQNKAQAYADQKNCIFYETSAKNSNNVNEAFLKLTKSIIEKKQENPQYKKKIIKQVQLDQAQQQKGWCC